MQNNQAAQTMPGLHGLSDAADYLARNPSDEYAQRRFRERMEQVRAALSQTAGVAPGWKLVPVEPTEAMLEAGFRFYGRAAYEAMVESAPAASGGERAPLSERLYRGPAHDPSGRERGTEPQATSESIPSSAASVGGVHPDALQDGTRSKSTAKRVEALGASGGKRTIQQRGLADPNPYKASESPLLTNPEWGVQLNSPSAASVGERARESVAIAIWHRWGDEQRLTWEEEPEKAAFLDVADEVIKIVRSSP